MTKCVYIETYGCQMNEYDTELVRSILQGAHYHFVNQETQADVVMLNTCSVRDNANRKVHLRVQEIRRARGKQPVAIGILGCMATNFKTALLEDPSLGIDFIAGPDSYKQLPSLIEQVWEGQGAAFDVTLSEFETYSDVMPIRQHGVNAWVAIMRGCNNFCTFCVVPYTRGRERSRTPESVVEEVERLVDAGHQQVTLLGQNVNSYRSGSSDFTDLMDRVSLVPGVRRVRFTSPHPKDFPDRLLTLMAERDTICKQIHLPLQAGNDRILHKMNRTYTQGEYLALVDRIRSLVPGVALSTDIIVGFPTETHEEFLDTLEVVKRVQFDSAYIFKYSERPQTVAARRFPDDVSEADKTHRIVCLNEVQREQSRKKNEACIGKEEWVLMESLSTKKSDTDCQGRTDANRLVILPFKEGVEMGQWAKVRIVGATPNVLKGEWQ